MSKVVKQFALAVLGVVSAALFSLSTVNLASANVGDLLGFGAKTMGLGGAGVTGDTGGFAAYHNPAALAFESKERFFFSWGLAYLRPSFTSIGTVVTQNTYVADQLSTGSVDTTYKDTFGQMLGVSYKLFPEFHNVTIGMVAFLPLAQLAYMDTGQAYIPEYVMYRSRSQRPQIEAAVGAQITPDISFGVGLHTSFTVTGNASVFLNTQSNTTSTMNFATSLKPGFSTYAGLLANFGGETKPFSVGLVVRAPNSSNLTMPLSSSARVFGNFAAVDFGFTGNSVLFYDPAAIELGGSWKIGASRFVAQLDHQWWNTYLGPAMSMSTPSVTNCQGTNCSSLQLAPGVTVNPDVVNLLIPRAGWEYRWSSVHTMRLGYSYRGSIFKVIPNGNGNYLDPAKHIVTAGWGLDFNSFLGFTVPSHIDFSLNYQQLLSQHIVKTAGNEVGNMSDQKIGSPDYYAGGQLYGGAFTLALAF